MKITLVRNATILLELRNRRILVDPMLDPAGARPPIEGTANPVSNPTVELPLPAEDVVAGLRTPRPLAKRDDNPGVSLEEMLPESYAELFEVQRKLEHRFRDMQDLEFTIEAGTLYLLQTRNGKRSARASVRIAVDMVEEGLLHPDEAILRIPHGLIGPCGYPERGARTIALRREKRAASPSTQTTD